MIERRADTGETAGSKAACSSPQHRHGEGCAHGTAGEPRPFDTKALVSARRLFLSRGGRMLLSAIDFDLYPRKIVTLIGPNGSGKTTLVRTLLGLETPDSGAVLRQPDRKIGYVPQRFSIDPALPMTVERFLELGGRTRGTQIGDTLAEVGAERVRRQQLDALSGGELQRVVLARALLGDPQLLVLDEPVRGVDYIGEAELYALIARLRDTRGLGVLLVSHDLHVVMASSDLVVCLNRHVCCSGVPETVAQHPEYARLFGAEAARSFALYHHNHDHRHDLAGEPTGHAHAHGDHEGHAHTHQAARKGDHGA